MPRPIKAHNPNFTQVTTEDPKAHKPRVYPKSKKNWLDCPQCGLPFLSLSSLPTENCSDCKRSSTKN